MATFEICEIFSDYYFSYARDYKATLARGNKLLSFGEEKKYAQKSSDVIDFQGCFSQHFQQELT